MLLTDLLLLLLLPTTTYYYLLLPTTTYYYLLLPTTTYYYLLLPTTTYYYLLLPTTTYTSPVNGGPKSLPAQTSFEQGSLLVNQVALLDSRLSPASRWSSKLMKLWKLHYYTNSFKIQPPIQSNHVHSIPWFCHLQILGLSLPISVAPP